MRQHIALYGSPRRGGFSSQMQDSFTDIFLSAGNSVEKIYIDELKVNPCTACEACRDSFSCIFDDDMTPLYPLLRDASLITVSTPVYFSGVPGPLKTVIDRCQVIWELDLRSPGEIPEKEVALLAAAGSDYPGSFEGVFLTMRHFFNTAGGLLDEDNSFFLYDTDQLSELPENLIVMVRAKAEDIQKKLFG